MSRTLRTTIRSILNEGENEIAATRRRLEAGQATIETAETPDGPATGDVTLQPVPVAAVDKAVDNTINEVMDPAHWAAANAWVQSSALDIKSASQGLLNAAIQGKGPDFDALKSLIETAITEDKNKTIPAYQIFLAQAIEIPEWAGELGSDAINLIGDIATGAILTRGVGSAAAGAASAPLFVKAAEWITTYGAYALAGTEILGTVIEQLSTEYEDLTGANVEIPTVAPPLKEHKRRRLTLREALLQEGILSDTVATALSRVIGREAQLVGNDAAGAALALILRAGMAVPDASGEAVPSVLKKIADKIAEIKPAGLVFESDAELAQFIAANQEKIFTAEIQAEILNSVRSSLQKQAFQNVADDAFRATEENLANLISGEPKSLAEQVFKDFAEKMGAIVKVDGVDTPRLDVKAAMEVVSTSWRRVAAGEIPVSDVATSSIEVIDTRLSALTIPLVRNDLSGTQAWLETWKNNVRAVIFAKSDFPVENIWFKVTIDGRPSTFKVLGVFEAPNEAGELVGVIRIRSAEGAEFYVTPEFLGQKSLETLSGIKQLASDLNQRLGTSLQGEIDSITTELTTAVAETPPPILAKKFAEVLEKNNTLPPVKDPSMASREVRSLNSFRRAAGVKIPGTLGRIWGKAAAIFKREAQKSVEVQAEDAAKKAGGKIVPILKNILILAATDTVVPQAVDFIWYWQVGGNAAARITALESLMTQPRLLTNLADRHAEIADRIVELYGGGWSISGTMSNLDQGVTSGKYTQASKNIKAYAAKLATYNAGQPQPAVTKESRETALRSFLREAIRSIR